ncbi:hypothetical protein AVEN_153440-1 [Araneus ventricosus]|uniref:Uncharacterized protein n=1 Tax=Araneus ventricosus TaxID=182803 RepID=A0A4Y2VAA2_ARAVE|nr:hypothetical protein AVEN_153440-1 [Araneus ventricosus]
MERLRKLLADDETDENPEFDNEENEVLEDNFSDHESFSKYDTESEEDGDSGNEDVNYLVWFPSEDGVQWRKTKFRHHIRCLNILAL